MADRAAEIEADLHDADTPGAILEAVARAVWYNAQRRRRVPSGPDTDARRSWLAWMPNVPPGNVWDEVDRRAELAAWRWRRGLGFVERAKL